MIHVFLICLACCCSSLMPLKQSDSIISENHIQVVESKSKRNYLGGDEVNYFTASDFLANSFGEVFYKEVGDLQSPATANLPYTARTTNTIEYNYESESVFGWALQGGFSNNLIHFPTRNGNVNGLSFYSSGSSITFNGTSSGSNFLLQGLDIPLSAGTYSLSFSSYIELEFGFTDGYSFINGLTRSFTLSDDKVLSYIWLMGSQTFNSVTINFMLNSGSSSLPYEPYFIGGYPSTNISFPIRFLDIKKEYFSNSSNNTYMYHYTMDFSASRPGVGKTRIFSVITDIMPEIKRVDTQGNLWPGGFWSYTYLDFNKDYYDIPLNSFMYGESSATGQLAPILNKYIRNLTYGDSYQGGYDAGYDNGYNIGNNYGYQRGYSEGIAYAQEQSSTALTIFTGIIEVGLLPVNVFLKMFEYEVFGINIAGLVSGLITIAMIMILLRFIFGGKQNGK